MNQASVGKYLSHVFMPLLDTCYFSYKMRMALLDFIDFVTSTCFLVVVPVHLVHSKFMCRNQHRTQLQCSLHPIVTQEAQCFDQERSAVLLCLEMSLPYALFPSSVTSSQSVVHSPWLLRLNCEPDPFPGSDTLSVCSADSLLLATSWLCRAVFVFYGEVFVCGAVFDIKSEMNFRRFPAFY